MSTTHDPAPQEPAAPQQDGPAVADLTGDIADGTSSGATEVAATQEAEWQRKRRLAEIFGDVLPSTTRDERDPGSSGGPRRSASEEWLLSQVPPHHGGHG